MFRGFVLGAFSSHGKVSGKLLQVGLRKEALLTRGPPYIYGQVEGSSVKMTQFSCQFNCR